MSKSIRFAFIYYLWNTTFHCIRRQDREECARLLRWFSRPVHVVIVVRATRTSTRHVCAVSQVSGMFPSPVAWQWHALLAILPLPSYEMHVNIFHGLFHCFRLSRCIHLSFNLDRGLQSYLSDCAFTLLTLNHLFYLSRCIFCPFLLKKSARAKIRIKNIRFIMYVCMFT